MSQHIPLDKPYVTGREVEYVAEAIRQGQIASGGRYTQACAELLQRRLGVRRVLMTPSCTAALEMAARLCELGPGDEAIMPSFTFVSTANAVCLAGATPVFVDIRPDTLNLDESLVEQAITPRTKAILPVHYGGVGCEMDALLDIAHRHGLRIVEDAAQAIGATYKDRSLGSIGSLGTLSFHATKNLAAGEGGALCVNDPELVARAEILREKGTNRSQYFRGEVDKYNWVDVGSSYLPAELTCAYLLAQLEALDEISKRRRQLYEVYHQSLAPLEQAGYLRRPIVPDACRTNHHIYYVLLADEATRDAVMDHLRGQGIGAVFHYVPLHTAPMARHCKTASAGLPVTESLSGRLLRLPMYHELTGMQQQRVVDEIGRFFHSRQETTLAANQDSEGNGAINRLPAADAGEQRGGSP